MEDFYGIPATKTLVIKQPHDRMTTEKVLVKNWRAEATATENKNLFDNLPNGDVDAFFIQLEEHEKMKKEKQNTPSEKQNTPSEKKAGGRKKKEYIEKAPTDNVKANPAFPSEKSESSDASKEEELSFEKIHPEPSGEPDSGEMMDLSDRMVTVFNRLENIIGKTKSSGKFVKAGKDPKINPITREQINDYLVELGKPPLSEKNKNKNSVVMSVLNSVNTGKLLTKKTPNEFWKLMKEASDSL